MEKSRKPKIRFKGFTDDWEQRELKDMCTIITKQTGFDYSTTIKPSLITTKEDDTYPFIQNKDFEGMNINLDTDFYIPISVAEKYPKITLDQLSLLISISGRIGNIGLYSLDSKAFIGGAVGICKLKNIEDGKTTLYELLSPIGQKYFNSLIKASSHANITVEDIRNIEVLLPKRDEEKKKINIYFDKLDNLITLHQRKLEKLMNVKKSMLEKMFPKQGSVVPKIRFCGFTDAWEQRELGELILEYKKTVDSSCTLPVLTSSKTEGVILQEEHFGRKQQHDITGYNVLPRSFCTYRNRSDGVDFTFNVNECCDMGIISKFYPVFYGNDNDTFFLSLVLNNSDEVVHEIAFTCIGTGQKVLSFLDLQKMSIRVPKQSEQKKISTYFKQLDDLITLHQRKLEKLKNIKKSMLEKMFI